MLENDTAQTPTFTPPPIEGGQDTPAPAAEPAADQAASPEGGEQPPAAEPPKSEEPSTNDLLDQFNAERQRELVGDDPDADDAAATTTEVPEAVVFAETDDFAAVQEKRAKYLEQVEITPELETILSRQDAEIERLSAIAGQVSNSEASSKILSAFDAIIEPEIGENGELKVNAAPLVELLRTQYKSEFEPIAKEFLSQDSPKYAGKSMMEQLIVDEFGPQKAAAAFGYLHANVPLPVIPAGVNLPESIKPEYKEAYMQLPEPERFEIEGLLNDVRDLTERVASASDYNKEELEKELADKQNRLNGKMSMLDTFHLGLQSDKDRQQREARQQQEAAAAYQQKVLESYNKDLFEMSEAFSKDLAGRLTFVDEGSRIGLARDINTRAFNALGFLIAEDGSFIDDPFADRYAAQLKEEGINFDFNKGRELLKQLFASTALVTRLSSESGVNPLRVERAEAKRRDLRNEIKAERVSLLGQLTTKYVKGVTDTTNAAAKKQLEKQQAVRPRANGNGAPPAGKAKPTSDAIADYNRAQAEKIANGDDLYNSLTS